MPGNEHGRRKPLLKALSEANLQRKRIQGGGIGNLERKANSPHEIADRASASHFGESGGLLAHSEQFRQNVIEGHHRKPLGSLPSAHKART
jgi:hypothetical protein